MQHSMHTSTQINLQVRNPWAVNVKKSMTIIRSDQTVGSSDEELREQSADYYRCKQIGKCGDQTITLVKCCVTETTGDHTQVVAARISCLAVFLRNGSTILIWTRKRALTTVATLFFWQRKLKLH